MSWAMQRTLAGQSLALIGIYICFYIQYKITYVYILVIRWNIWPEYVNIKKKEICWYVISDTSRWLNWNVPSNLVSVNRSSFSKDVISKINVFVESSWNVMAHGDAREGRWRGNWRMEWVASTLHTTSEHGVSSITTADAHTSAASRRLNWRPHADLNGLDRFAERRNLVSARVPSQFNWPLNIYILKSGSIVFFKWLYKSHSQTRFNM